MENKKHIVAITALIKQGDRVLVIKRNQNEVAYPGKWAFPGGKVERGETVSEALFREVKEEVGLDVEEHSMLYDFTFVRPDGHNVVGLCFLVGVVDNSVSLHNDFDEFRWVTAQELSSLDHIPGMEKEVKKAFQ